VISDKKKFRKQDNDVSLRKHNFGTMI